MLTMPFGKHRGMPLNRVPPDYLVWVLDNVDLTNRPTLEEEIRIQLGLESAYRRPGPGPEPGVNGKALELEPVLKTWLRSLAMDFHPDRRGGSHEAMTAINEAHDRLRKLLKTRRVLTPNRRSIHAQDSPPHLATR